MFTLKDDNGQDFTYEDEIETFINARYISASEAFWTFINFHYMKGNQL